jgi:hypothetical protein
MAEKRLAVSATNSLTDSARPIVSPAAVEICIAGCVMGSETKREWVFLPIVREKKIYDIRNKF